MKYGLPERVQVVEVVMELATGTVVAALAVTGKKKKRETKNEANKMLRRNNICSSFIYDRQQK